MNKRKKYIYLLLLFLTIMINDIYSQKLSKTIPNLPNFDLAKYNFGFYLGADLAYFTITPQKDFSKVVYKGDQIIDLLADSARVMNMEGKPGPGFVVGMVSQLRLSKHLDLRFIPALQFGERSVHYTIESYRNGDTIMLNERKNVVSSFIDIPIHLKFKGDRMHNFRPYVFFGPTFKWDLATQLKKKDNNMNNLRIKLNAFDIALDVGVGFDIYTNWFKFSTQFNMCYGFLNVLHQEDNIYSMSIKSLTSKLVQLTVTFE